uniref:NADH dehydrogenase subunit 4L n=1 Tax=Manayunkia occidentalis TaxID=2704156 RepID=UPI00165F5796|nr:NADH dehydrogenase subunit 4L [Manayunkia occidentalis]QLM00887.1 NADH dehydrogenase subunit 4L [Manayunkia occidentalis]
MPFNMFYIFMLSALLAIMAVILQRVHFLMTLLYLELMIISLTLFLISVSSYNSLFYLIITLTLGACEASMGLALLISMIRFYGNDMLMSLTLFKC